MGVKEEEYCPRIRILCVDRSLWRLILVLGQPGETTDEGHRRAKLYLLYQPGSDVHANLQAAVAAFQTTWAGSDRIIYGNQLQGQEVGWYVLSHWAWQDDWILMPCHKHGWLS